MVATPLSAYKFQETPEDTDKLTRWLAGEFQIDNINPFWPTFPLNEVGEFDGGRHESWSEAKSRYWSYCYGDSVVEGGGGTHDVGQVNEEERLMFGTTHLPEDLLQAAHKRLFGSTTNCPSAEAIWTIGHALWSPSYPLAYKHSMPFRMWCKEAKRDWDKRNTVKNTIADLLAELDS